MTQKSSDLPPYYDHIYRYAYRFMGSLDDADDVRQEVFCRYYDSLSKDESKRSYQGNQLRNYLYFIARNYMIDIIRQRGLHGKIAIDEDGDVSLVYSGLTASGASPEQAAQTSELQAIVRQKVSQLTPQKQEILHLRYVEQMKAKDIAEIIGKSYGNVRRILSVSFAELSKDKELEALN